VKGPSELKLSITISTSKSVAELKEVIAGKSDVEKDRQRLIYSGESADVLRVGAVWSRDENTLISSQERC
jgi:hypothetical protein